METLKSTFHQATGYQFFLEPDIKSIETYLVKQGWISPQDNIQKIENPGAGNMNMVLRVIPQQKPPMIIKQARPWVEKYPQIAAPMERMAVEHAFYKLTGSHPVLANYIPELLGFDPENNILLIEDLGESKDFTYVYKNNACFDQQDLHAAVNYLNLLKKVRPPAGYPTNIKLRKLNHQHIFNLPFQRDNGFDLDEIQGGLQRASEICLQDVELKDQINRLGSMYLAAGSILLHGDFYPGSMLKTSDGLKVIDPEFSFVGPEEWDMAIFTAHLFMSSTPMDLIRDTVKLFDRTSQFDHGKFSGFTGTEILRRLLGLAQLPLELNLQQKSMLMDQALGWIKSGKIPTLSNI